MKLQRYGQNGKPRNETKEMPEDEYLAYVRRTGDQTWRPVRLKSKSNHPIPMNWPQPKTVKPKKHTPTQK